MKYVAFLCILASAMVFADADHLLITEFCVTPSDSEFVEIYNPTASAVSLSLIHITDLYGDSSAFSALERFYPQIAIGPIDPQYSSDFLAKFPMGDEIAPGQVIVIAMNGLEFQTSYGFPADYDLEATGGGATPMIVPTNGFIGSGPGLTNSGETLTLFSFDDAGTSPIFCYDIDYAYWGNDSHETVDKSGIVIFSGTYLDDTPEDSQDAIYYTGHDTGNSFHRVDMNEGTETLTGGNGVTGHDETSENLSVTWVEAEPTPGYLYPTALVRQTWGAIKSVF